MSLGDIKQSRQWEGVTEIQNPTLLNMFLDILGTTQRTGPPQVPTWLPGP